MSNTITLPNGATWDNDLTFRENTPEAQFWFFETLKMALLNDPSIKKGLILQSKVGYKINSTDRKLLCYSKLERDGLILSVDAFYKHKDHPNTDLDDEASFFNIDNWTIEKNPHTKKDAKFQIETIE